ncbi:hypothetical protein GQE99_14485 [Maritimibacter sp. DP07]|uniref:Phage protein, HK97 gp10 family n=1 Tax=Maritimibacter harenae TaxID=2606218 RepID=A0A845M8K4_9RHOB|nr:hypothetical protein [Maritimibacter harenae]
MKEMKTSTARGVARRSMKKAFEPFVAAAKSAAPVGFTGELSENIAVGTKLTQNQRRELRGSVSRSVTQMYAGATKEAPHAHLVEFGTGPRWQKSTGRYVGEMPANPFMRRSWEATKGRVLAKLSKQLGEELEKAAARAARKAAKARG